MKLPFLCKLEAPSTVQPIIRLLYPKIWRYHWSSVFLNEHKIYYSHASKTASISDKKSLTCDLLLLTRLMNLHSSLSVVEASALHLSKTFEYLCKCLYDTDKALFSRKKILYSYLKYSVLLKLVKIVFRTYVLAFYLKLLLFFADTWRATLVSIELLNTGSYSKAWNVYSFLAKDLINYMKISTSLYTIILKSTATRFCGEISRFALHVWNPGAINKIFFVILQFFSKRSSFLIKSQTFYGFKVSVFLESCCCNQWAAIAPVLLKTTSFNVCVNWYCMEERK